MDQEKQQNIALMRYSVISPIISGLWEDYSSLTAFFNDASAKGVLAPDGSVKHFAPQTIERWYRNYKKGGFDALIPTGRVDQGLPRKLDADLQEQIRYLKTNYPRMSAASIHRQLQDNGSIKVGTVSESTVNRYVNQLSLEMKTTTNPDMRRYERPHINEVWCGDSSVGPYLKTDDGKKHKVYIIALIDDASRFIVGIDVFFNDNFVNLMSVIKSAVAKYGRPQMFNFDNGSSYKNKQMELLAARIGSVIHYDQPYTPTQKAKIERWFRTMKDQWMSGLDIRDFHSLDELRGNLFAYVQKYNQTVHSSLNGRSPQDRYFSEPNLFHRLSDEEIDHSFLLEIERRVSADNVITIDQVEYEVDCRFSKQHIKLRYSPGLDEIYIVEADGTLTPIRLLNKVENSKVKRDKVHICRGED
ncbi:MAG: transposase [Spirochaetales bacterium]|jgi:transposase InsO family protein|uniref:Homeodomain-like domain-containing protein n=1 Tax=Butyrivibrio fibrisolvens DSM 3071 TaxID=1121131 RepID=A0A1M5Q7B7_BUTFI|nr:MULTISPECIES: DDE-type integrase/transposase/recombinase [Butyrivibrio]MBO7349586.1 transposase [Spirochaetales bacterium]SHH09671.1 Homeodomain-like domain-containing protein [Butyrivibrio fibrisolvens DSM 3071]